MVACAGPPVARMASAIVPCLAAGPLAAASNSTGAGPNSTPASDEIPLPDPGSRLDVPAMKLLDGRTVAAGAFDGRILVIYWWASWCPFCALQSPEIDKLWRNHEAEGLQVLGLSIDKTPEAARAHLESKGYAFPSAWVDPALAMVLPKPRGLPVTVVRGRDGRVLQSERGQMFPEDIELLSRWLTDSGDHDQSRLP